MSLATRRVVANSTPLILLGGIERLDLLRSMYGEVSIPTAVFEEVACRDDAAGKVLAGRPDWIRVEVAPTPDDLSLLRSRLHAGEVEAIMLARTMDADLVIIDDNAAKKTAKFLGLTVTGTLGVLVKAKRRGLLDKVSPLVDGLLAQGMYVSDEVVELVKRAAGEY